MWRLTAVLVVMRNCFERIFYSHNQPSLSENRVCMGEEEGGGGLGVYGGRRREGGLGVYGGEEEGGGIRCVWGRGGGRGD